MDPIAQVKLIPVTLEGGLELAVQHLRVEMSFHARALKPINRPLQPLIAQVQKQAPEVPDFPCFDPIETAADTLSTLAWRVCARKWVRCDDDPTIVRHLHDLAALESTIAGASGFADLAQKTAEDDTGRGGRVFKSRGTVRRNARFSAE
jgi:hypothetical protein